MFIFLFYVFGIEFDQRTDAILNDRECILFSLLVSVLGVNQPADDFSRPAVFVDELLHRLSVLIGQRLGFESREQNVLFFAMMASIGIRLDEIDRCFKERGICIVGLPHPILFGAHHRDHSFNKTVFYHQRSDWQHPARSLGSVADPLCFFIFFYFPNDYHDHPITD